MATPLRVLVVEDSEDDALLLQRELRRGGYAPEVTRVDTPEAMRAALAQHGWDLVISDYRLPGFSAPAALKLLQETGQDLPFIIVSGLVTEEDAVAAMKAGAHDYVTKGKLGRLAPVIARELRDAEQRRERQKLQREQHLQSQKLEIIGRLAGGVVHDFNNLLTAISGHAELGAQALASGHRAADNLEEIRQAVDRATHLTRQLLTFARRQPPETSAIDLNEVVGDMSRLLKRLVGESLDLTTELSPDLRSVKADPGQFQQVLMNLVINARDAMPGNGAMRNEGRIHLRTANVTLPPGSPDGPAGNYVAVSVSDNGRGMTPEVKAHLFEPFFTTKEPGKGTGLGLSTCQEIVNQAGGHINVQSEVGRGTTFTVCLPASNQRPAASVKTSQPDLAMERGTETVLLAEDDNAVRGMVVAMLKTQGYTVLQAGNGEEALNVARSHEGQRIHLLLTDVIMPRMGGVELAQEFNHLHPEAKVLFTSGYTGEPVSFQGIVGKGAPFIQKPYLPSDLVRKVREVLGNPLDERPKAGL